MKRAYGFTLVELIVVISILAILATVGFLSLSGYSQDAKESANRANVRSVYSAISSESAITGNSPRYYVVHDPSVALSWAVVYASASNSVILTWGAWNAPGTNYSAGLPDYPKLKLNPDKFKLASRAGIFVPVFADSSSGVVVGAADVTSGSSRLASYYQAAGISPSSGSAVVYGNYPALSGSVAGLIDADADKTTTGALVDGTAPASSAIVPPAPTQIAAGTNFVCAVLSDGTVKCWGQNMSGQLGNGNTVDQPAPVKVTGLTGVVELALGANFSCARIAGGTVKCWGSGGNGRLGNNTTTDSLSPVTVLDASLATLTGAVKIYAGNNHACALTSSGQLKCWGDNSSGMVKGDGSTWGDIKTAFTVPLGSTVTSALLGSMHTCASLSDGTVKCWGYNQYGQVGDGTTITRYSPVPVPSLTGVAELFPSTKSHNNCARITDGTVRCWGLGNNGQMGNGASNMTNTGVQTPTGVSGVVSGFGSYDRYYAILSDGSVKAWGNSWSSPNEALWPGIVAPRSTPVVLGSTAGVLQVVSGGMASCLRTANEVKCWSQGTSGQLGDGTFVSRGNWANVTGF